MSKGKLRPFNAFVLALVAVLYAGAVAHAQQGLELRLRLKKGDVYRLRLTVDQHIVQSPPAGERGKQQPQEPQVFDQTVGVGYSMTVEDVDADGVMTVATRYDSMRFRRKGPSGESEYDSENPPKQPNPAAKAFAAVVGLGFKMTLTPGGAVKSVDGVEEMLAEVVRRLELADAVARASAQAVLADQFGPAAMRQKMQDLFGAYPPSAVAVGDVWGRKSVMSSGFPVVVDGKYTLKARQDGVADVAVEAALTPNPDARPVDLGTGKVTYALSGTQRGNIRLLESTGWTRSLTLEQDLAGSIRLDAPGDKDAEIPMTVKSKLVLETID